MVEEALTILLSFALGYFIDNSWAKIQRKIPSEKDEYFKIIVRRIRIHHNWLGYVAIIWGFFDYPLILVPMGIGIIIGHKIRDNLFWFIESVEKDTKYLRREIKKYGKPSVKTSKIKKRHSK